MLLDFAKNIFADKRNILIINEGDPKGINLMDSLKNAGFEVASVENSPMFSINIFKRNIDLIIILIGNSQKDGIKILENLKNNKIFIPTMLALDSEGISFDVEETKKYGIVDVLLPEEVNTLGALAKIRKYFNIEGQSSSDSLKLKLVEPKVEPKNVRILLVEDYKELREALANKLSKSGYSVFLARDGEEAVLGIGTAMPDLVLLDIIMPGISGFEVLKKIKSDHRTSHIPVIMLSNLGEEEDIQKARILGAVDYLVKANVTTDDIIRKLDFYIRK